LAIELKQAISSERITILVVPQAVLDNMKEYQNAFLRPYNKDDTSSGTTRWTVDESVEAPAAALRTEASNKQYAQTFPTSLNRAKATHVDERSLYGRHVDEEVKHIVEIIELRVGVLKGQAVQKILEGVMNGSNRND